MTAAANVVELLAEHGLTVAVAESLTGGMLVAELISPPGASAVILGAVVAYNTQLKSSVLGVSTELLETHGPVHPEVARQMAQRVREVLAVDDTAASIGISTTGVAGPASQGGQHPGTVFLGLSWAQRSEVRELHLEGSRDDVRAATVASAIAWIAESLEQGLFFDVE